MEKPIFNYFNTFSMILNLHNFVKIRGIFFAAFLCIFMSSLMRRINWYEISPMDPLKSLCNLQNSMILILFLEILNFKYFLISGAFFAALLCRFMCSLMIGIKWYEITPMDPLKSLCKSLNSIILVLFIVILNFKYFFKIRGIFFAAFLCRFMCSLRRGINCYEISPMDPLKFLC